ncbi:PF20097 family protein [Clostridioides difficile]
MKCPYCGIDMINGKVCSGRDNAVFIKDNAKKKLGVFHESIKLTSYFGEDLEAFICENCKKIIINLE